MCIMPTSMSDLTVIYYTSNLISDYFANNVRGRLLLSIGDLPLISVSQKPINFGENIYVGPLGQHVFNLYQQILIGTKAAKTKYVAMAEDDVLYSPGSFTFHTPTPGVFAYNQNVWCIYTWVKPAVFSFKDRINLYSLICERELFIEAMEERFAKWPDDSKISIGHFAEPGKYEGRGHLGVTERKIKKLWSPTSNIAFSHQSALSFLNMGTRKRLGSLQSFEVPYWGRAKDIIKEYR